jgi:hypothetical protein
MLASFASDDYKHNVVQKVLRAVCDRLEIGPETFCDWMRANSIQPPAQLLQHVANLKRKRQIRSRGGKGGPSVGSGLRTWQFIGKLKRGVKKTNSSALLSQLKEESSPGSRRLTNQLPNGASLDAGDATWGDGAVHEFADGGEIDDDHS